MNWSLFIGFVLGLIMFAPLSMLVLMIVGLRQSWIRGKKVEEQPKPSSLDIRSSPN